ADARAEGAAQFRQRLRGVVIAIGRVTTYDVRYQHREIPGRVGAVAQTGGHVLVYRLMLELGPGRNATHRLRAAAQLILIDVVVFNAEAPSGLGGVAHRGVGAQSAAAGRTGVGAVGHAKEHYQRHGRQPGMTQEPSPALCGQPAIRWKRSHEMSSKAPEE